MVLVWALATVAALFGSIAGSFYEKTPLTAVAFGLMALAFAIGTYRSINKS
jgi:hypothetical protein